MISMFIRFASAGAVGTAVHYAILIALVHLASSPPSIAAACGAIAGAVVNYWLSRRYVFRSEVSHGKALPRFVVVAVIGTVLNGLLVGQLTSLGLHYLLAQVLTTGIVLLINFGASRVWVFRTSNR